MTKKSKTFKFRSGLEERIAEQLDSLKIDYDYETLTIKYEKPSQLSRYTPDFILPNGIIIEGKGQFLTSDRKKHRLIKQQFGKKYDIRFVFSNPNQKIGKKSSTRYRDWCDRYGFQWASKDVPIEWIKENAKK